jgi:hypothetical protein
MRTGGGGWSSMSGGTKGGGVFDRHGLQGDASWSSCSPLSCSLPTPATADDELVSVGRAAGVGALNLPMTEDASSGDCVNGAEAAAADTSAANWDNTDMT